MGKGGGGCVSNKRRKPVGISNRDPPKPTSNSSPIFHQFKTLESSPVAESSSSSSTKPNQKTETETETLEPLEKKKTPLKIFIVFYSMYGLIEQLAKRVKQGVDAVDGVEGMLFRVPETLPTDVLEQMRAAEKDEGVPVVKLDEIVNADGFLFGFPTRFGSMAAQMKAFFDSTGDIWEAQRFAGVPAGFFVSTGTQGGGQETTAWTAITQLAHHGMLYVPIGYTFGDEMFQTESVRGGSSYGAGVVSGDSSRKPSETEMALAEHQGRYMATIVKRLGLRPP